MEAFKIPTKPLKLLIHSTYQKFQVNQPPTISQSFTCSRLEHSAKANENAQLETLHWKFRFDIIMADFPSPISIFIIIIIDCWFCLSGKSRLNFSSSIWGWKECCVFGLLFNWFISLMEGLSDVGRKCHFSRNTNQVNLFLLEAS